MSDTLTTLISKVQALLGDNGTIFTTPLVTAALRQTLTEFNYTAPQFIDAFIAGIDNQYEYELTDQDPAAVRILDVLRQGENQNELDLSIAYDSYIQDERVFFRLRAPITNSETLVVHYTRYQTINGLDSGIESTILAHEDQIIVNGACYHAVMIRATSRVETINLSKDQSDNYREVAGHFRSAFRLGLANIARTKRAPVGEPDTHAWNDNYHNWNQ